ncbi:hypothetical protein HAX54_053331, partial [Datura stramonium]|nr:hypothetical protein [Datura stramonium]
TKKNGRRMKSGIGWMLETERVAKSGKGEDRFRISLSLILKKSPPKSLAALDQVIRAEALFMRNSVVRILFRKQSEEGKTLVFPLEIIR